MSRTRATGCAIRHPGTAKTRDIAEGLALAVELDDGDTATVLARLEALIGPPTLVVLSGSLWADPETGELHPKRHAYWRLSEAARDEADLPAYCPHLNPIERLVLNAIKSR